MASEVNLNITEKELKKRLIFPYHWGRIQNDTWDKSTSYIYKKIYLKDLITQIKVHFSQLQTKNSYDAYFNYAINRWYNFWSAKAIEQIFTMFPNVKAEANQYNRTVDFYIEGIPFDHKTTIFPKAFKKDFNSVLKHPESLTYWFYIKIKVIKGGNILKIDYLWCFIKRMDNIGSLKPN